MLNRITEKKRLLDQYRPLPTTLTRNLYEWRRIALTYTSNALEGNTLTHSETALVVEKHLTIGGKSITEHLEAVNHAQAVDYIKQLAQDKTRQQLQIGDILSIHQRILHKIDDAHAGVFRTVTVCISGSQVPSPNYLKVPTLMDEFMQWLTTADGHIATIAADAHLKFVLIHPFTDGNGRTARLLMNLVLLQQGYPLTIISNQKRLAYVDSIEKALLHQQMDDYYQIIFAAIEEGLDFYLKAIEESAV